MWYDFPFPPPFATLFDNVLLQNLFVIVDISDAIDRWIFELNFTVMSVLVSRCFELFVKSIFQFICIAFF